MNICFQVMTIFNKSNIASGRKMQIIIITVFLPSFQIHSTKNQEIKLRSISLIVLALPLIEIHDRKTTNKELTT